MGNKVAAGKVSKKKPCKAKPAVSKVTLPSKATTEIDDIFASNPPANTAEKPAAPVKQKATKAVTVVDASAAGKKADPHKNQQQARPLAGDDGFADSRGKQTKYTEDGMRVFYMDDLHIGEGNGDTPECPFDCQCCF
ncbi:hypothetical protein LPJ61_006792 [Coemansia biformis]|uniref:DUF1764-domain-containing protein n=1 Tax=Coemansia biformis TaxID=1286918 RepID=A0A9W7XTG0_9FUNG|nr:hypothetical protein LPJ61_006792 [Coemansia biformis]